MSLDREKAFANAERLLKQGRATLALDEYRRIAEDAPRDVLALNRIGDALSRAGRTAEALHYYEKAGNHFVQAGFYPRAVAIFKKIVKLAPSRLDMLAKIADLYVRQNLNGEARPYFLQSADAYLKAREFAKAREVYERLVAADPADLVNRVRLAEARAAEGDTAGGGEDLLLVGASMLGVGRFEDAERSYRRAAELLPDRAEPAAGIAKCLAGLERADEAIATIDAAISRRPADAKLVGEKLLLLEALGRREESARFLAAPQAVSLRDDEILRAFSEAHALGSDEGLLQRLDPVLSAWRGAGRDDRVANLLDRISLAAEGEWAPALERLLALRVEGDASPRIVARVLERAIAAHTARGNLARAAELQVQLTAIPADGDSEGSTVAGDREEAVREETSLTGDEPAVPRTPQDHEAVSGHVTEAEVFLKYGLQSEALQQLREAVRRFPGHVQAVQRLVDLLRARPDRDELRQALVTLALARRAVGDLDGGRQAAAEAAMGPLPPETIEAFSRLGLWSPQDAAPPAAESEPEPRVVSPTPRSKRAPRETAEAPAPPPPARTPPPKPARTAAPPAGVRARTTGHDEDFVVDFEDDGGGVEVGPNSPPRAPVRVVRVATPDMIEEIAFYVEHGMADEALKQVAALRTLGFSGADLDALERRASTGPPEPEAAAEVAGAPGDLEGFEIDDRALDEIVAQVRVDEVDLTAITEGLQVEPGSAEAPLVPEGEQSIEEVIGDFKRQVQETIGTGDFRTHYDLGIGFKEMGMIDDALDAFRAASRAPELFREACNMMALCHRERGELEEAVRCYREAIGAATGEEAEPPSGIRYELADLLAERGDVEGALREFREILITDPTYRDVRSQVAAMESRLPK